MVKELFTWISHVNLLLKDSGFEVKAPLLEEKFGDCKTQAKAFAVL